METIPKFDIKSDIKSDIKYQKYMYSEDVFFTFIKSCFKHMVVKHFMAITIMIQFLTQVLVNFI